MKKKLIIINGTMGVGKTATCALLNKTLEKSVWLDGDWCWMINPFIVNEENKKMVEENIRFLLRNFLKNSSVEYVIFNWILHQEELFQRVTSWIDDYDYELIKITLMCSQEELIKRLSKDIEKNIRDEDCIRRSLERAKLYSELNTIKIDTTEICVEETVDKIIEIAKRENF